MHEAGHQQIHAGVPVPIERGERRPPAAACLRIPYRVKTQVVAVASRGPTAKHAEKLNWISAISA